MRTAEPSSISTDITTTTPAPWMCERCADDATHGRTLPPPRLIGLEPQHDAEPSYTRFLIIPKADRADREPVLGGLTPRSEGDGTTTRNARCVTCRKVKFAKDADRCHCDVPVWEPSSLRQNVHPTVKPTDLMRHLVRLVTPPGGLVLDPFLGSGTTGLACELEGFPWVGIEREAEYVAIAEARLNGTQKGMGLAV